MSKVKVSGGVCLFIAALLFSFGGVMFKVSPWAAMSINSGRNIISAIIVLTYALSIKHKFRINKSVLLGAFCMFATTTLYAFANKMTTAANAIILQFAAPIFIILFMWLFFKERPKKLDIMACVVIFAGIICFFIDGLNAGGMLGNALALLSGVTYAGVFMMNTFPGSDSLSSIVIGQAFSGFFGLPWLFMETDFSFAPVGVVVAAGIFQLGIAYVFISKGLECTSPVTASLITGIEPVLNPVWTAIIYKENMGVTAIIGGVIVIGAVVVYNVIKERGAKRVEKAPAQE